MELYLLLIFAGILSGILTILFGFAGGFVVVPLVFSCIRLYTDVDSLAYQFAFKSAIATSLLLMVINAGLATYQQFKKGDIRTNFIFPLAFYIAIGAVIGTYFSFYISATVLKYLFVIYLLITIVDSIFRQIQIQQNTVKICSLAHQTQMSVGVFIGSIAAALGVGGSVMTVPLFRRCGLNMVSAVALANPLSIPVAVAGCITYCIEYVIHPMALGSDFIGYFYYPACICLIMSSYVGMKIAQKIIGKISDRSHERGYIILLCLAMISVIVQ
ncbi:sulfite exporter TauE/SafE family protein [Acinetobacter gerneri]|uniref:sulfite exporter TauE/SafE family protein n=1 Tax=Acinetobacter gerneri TaxID=202952 RepID=UPI0028B214DB|nr:sulfite exporter TauE/SafE family protein [Acinetobacter gerneri]